MDFSKYLTEDEMRDIAEQQLHSGEIMNKFDRLENFIKSQVDKKGALTIAKEVEALMYKNNLTEGPTLGIGMRIWPTRY